MTLEWSNVPCGYTCILEPASAHHSSVNNWSDPVDTVTLSKTWLVLSGIIVNPNYQRLINVVSVLKHF